MALQELPSGDFIDPEYNHVGGIWIQAPHPPQFAGWTVCIGAEKCVYFLSCRDEDEARAVRGAMAVRMGFVPPNDIKMPKEAMKQ